MPPKRIPLSCVGHTRPVLQLAYSGMTPDGIFLVSASKDGKPMLRNGQTGDWIGTFEDHDGAVWGVDIDVMGQRVMTGSADFSAKLFDATRGQVIQTLQHPHIVKAVSLSPDVNLVATACGDKKVRLFDLRANQDGHVISTHDQVINRVLFTADGNHILSGGEDGIIRTYDRTNSAEMNTMIGDPIKDLCRKADGRILASCSSSIKRLDITGTSVEHTVQVPTPVYTAAAHHAEDMLVWGGEDQLVHVCTEDGAVQDELNKHFGAVHCVRFSPDGQSFSSCSEDGTLLLWQVHPGEEYGLWRAQTDDDDSSATTTGTPAPPPNHTVATQ
ncbi:hypothetical protein PTSG_06495 [Salpingoeca rosetta]|uniref:Serine-threonine kinase receptor-associated protein n=1 Tax=Salpingoeca rosetta (strain ATCC 50818 / BSB-021) TaxID=946362 RepID=F2UFZ1_SALR5|nr:uncharacterized protein PTSG_06495 [Salpingoeca rosetta]EGD75419.1 hypothetical protein PTSG_06495 [Salpingoeca rosetta]|eukprot:XP_004991876.1 hypothetical protein PTSG_06495 [Salpingoeca rosetta]